MTASDRPLLQRVYTARASALTRPVYEPTQRAEWPRYYFQLNLVSEAAREAPSDGKGRIDVVAMSAGHTYTMQAVVDADADGRTTLRTVTLNSDLELYLTSNHRLVQVAPLVCVVPQSVVSGATLTFQVRVAPEYLGDPVTLTLSYRRARATTNPIELARCALQGSAAQADQQLPTRQIVLDSRLSEQVRVLHVELLSETLYHVCSYWDEETEFAADILRPGVSPARFIRQQDLPWEIINKIRAKSANNPVPFMRWLKANLRKYGQEFNLIIHDDADETDMAWELIHIYLQPNECPTLPADLVGQVPLGALVTMTRWVPGLHWYDIEQALTVAETTTRGRVVAYLDHDQALPYSHREHSALTPFVVDRFGDIATFKLRLGSSLADTGLIYIGCHGIIVNEEAEKNFLLQLNQQEEIKVYDLTALPYLADLAARPIVVVNACHSAWLFRHEGVRYGLPVALLQQIAKDFIGTIGPVGDKCAAEMAEAIFQAVRSSGEGMRLAAFLRDRRADAFRHARNAQPNDEQWFDYLYTFMYVYYGNPFSRLRLALAPVSDEEGEHP